MRPLEKTDSGHKKLGEKWFDDYWMNYGKITIKTCAGKSKKLTKLSEYLEYRGKDKSLANPCIRPSKREKASHG